MFTIDKRLFYLLLHLLVLLRTIQSHIVLQFDGSRRPPSDPNFPTDSLGYIATASACLSSVGNGERDDSNYSVSKRTETMWLGGRALPFGSLKNSAEAEYEGLQLALEKTIILLESGQLPTNTGKITIQGDCKTVIDQMQERSRPRKLQSHHQRAQQYLGELEERCGIAKFDFELIPRNDNALCDGICNVIRSGIIESEAWTLALDLISELETNMDTTTGILPRCIGPENQSLIPYSKRPHLYHQLAGKAREMASHQALLDIGKQMVQEAKLIWANIPSRKSDSQRIQVYGIQLQLEAMDGLATKKSFKTKDTMERKNRGLLEESRLLLEDEDFTLFASSQSPIVGVPADVQVERELDQLIEAWLEGTKTSTEWQKKSCHWTKLLVDK